MTFLQNLRPGLHEVAEPYVNWYILQDGNDLTVVDAGLPASWRSLQAAVHELGRSLSDVKAVVLTHAHFDHVGFAERARRELNVPIYVHEREVDNTRHPLSYDHERSRLWYVHHPTCAAAMASFVWQGMLATSPIQQVVTYTDGAMLDVPGSPAVVFTPGHTVGHSSLHLADKDAVLAGDAFVLMDPYTGRVGPRVVARAATAHSDQAKVSLGRLRETGARHVYTGHGDPWNGAIEEAVAQANAAPVA